VTPLQTVLKAALGLALFWLVCAWLERVSLYHPHRDNLPTPAAYGLPYEAVALPLPGGGHVAGWFIPGRGPVTVLYTYGNGETMGAVVRGAPWRRMMRDLGVNVFLWDYPGYGRSPGRPGEAALYAGQRAALAYLRSRPGVDPHRIVVWGHSLGAFVAAEVAGDGSAAAAVLQAPGASVREAARDVLGWLPPVYWLYRLLPGLPREPYDTLQKLPRVPVPVLIVHGEADHVLPVRHGRLLSRAAPGVTLVTVPGAGHMSPWDGASEGIYQAYRQAVAALLDRIAGR
jgi:fermentation-respiration switch protein FrsA (DUF1100 family)